LHKIVTQYVKECFSPEIIWVVKIRRRWTGYVAWITERRCAYTILVGKQREQGQQEGLDIDWRITLRRIRWGGIDYPFIPHSEGATGRFL